ncbi:MAG: hypothetical protein WKF59_13705 [Chitinophagaceae bacterium]
MKAWGLMKLQKKLYRNITFLSANQVFRAHVLPAGGIYEWRRKGEFHLFNPQTIHLLQYSTRIK